MKLKLDSSRIHASFGRYSKRAKISASLLAASILVLCGVGIYGLTSQSNLNEQTDHCALATQNYEAINKKGDGPVDPKARRETYNSFKQFAEQCQQKDTNDMPKVDLLKLNFDRAITSYKFGDKEIANSYADKALAMNDQVPDEERGDKVPSKAGIAEQLGAVKNGSY